MREIHDATGRLITVLELLSPGNKRDSDGRDRYLRKGCGYQCHERGRYHLLNYRLELDPPLAPDDASWIAQLLREHGLTGT